MELRKKGISGHLGCLCFFALFPGFFFFYTMLALGHISAPPVGYFGAACFITLLLLAPIQCADSLRERSAHLHNIFLTLLLLNLILAVAVNYAFSNGSHLTLWHLISTAQFLACFLVFKYSVFSKPSMKLVVYASCVGMTVIVLSNVESGQFYLRLSAKNADAIPSYQGFAMAISFSFFIAASITKTTALRILLHLFAFTALYLNGARSEFVGYVLFSIVLEFLYTKHKPAVLLLALIVAPLSAAAIYFFSDITDGNRILLLFNLSKDTSLSARNEILLDGIDHIISSPFTGAYGSYTLGEYIHNALSVWVDIGIMGILILFSLISSLFIRVRAMYLSPHYSKLESCSAAGMLACCILLLVSSKYFLFPLLAAVCGYSSMTRDPKSEGLLADDMMQGALIKSP